MSGSDHVVSKHRYKILLVNLNLIKQIILFNSKPMSNSLVKLASAQHSSEIPTKICIFLWDNCTVGPCGIP
jgi:hypothetical protein